MQTSGRLSLFNRNAPIPSRKTYRLKFIEDGLGLPKEVEFEALDAAAALVIAHKEASSRSAELWCDGQKLCTIRRAAEDFWEISPAR